MNNPYQGPNTTASKVIRLVQHSALIRLNQLTGNRAVLSCTQNTLPGALPKGALLGHWMAFNLIAGPQFRITLRIYFDSKTVKALSIGSSVKKGSPRSCNAQSIIQGYCLSVNQLISAALERQNIEADFFLPTVTLALNEIYLPMEEYPTLAESYWTLEKDGLKLHYFLAFEMIDSALPKKLRSLPDDLDVFVHLADVVKRTRTDFQEKL